MGRLMTIIATFAGLVLLTFGAHEAVYGGLLTPLHVPVTAGPLRPFAIPGFPLLLIANLLVGGGAAFYLHRRLPIASASRGLLLKKLAAKGAMIICTVYPLLRFPLGQLLGPQGSQYPVVVFLQNLGLTFIFMGGCLAELAVPSAPSSPDRRLPMPKWSAREAVTLIFGLAVIGTQCAVYALVSRAAVLSTLPLVAGLFALAPGKIPAPEQLPRARRLMRNLAVISTAGAAALWIAPFAELNAAILRILVLDLALIFWLTIIRIGRAGEERGGLG
jgi:hypothetical protein